MTLEDTKLMFPMAPKRPAVTEWRGQAVHMLLSDDRVGDRGTLELDVRHRQGARYQYNVPLPNVVVTSAAAEGMEVRIGLSRKGQAVQVYTLGQWNGHPEIQWKSEPTWGDRLHAGVLRGPGRPKSGDAAELHRAEQEKEKRQREAAAEELDILGNGRDRNDMLQKWAQRLRWKAILWHNVLIDNRETQPGLEGQIKAFRVEDVGQAVSIARYHMKARQEAVEDRCRPDCRQARCLCRLDGPQELRGDYHGIKLQQPGRQVPMWLPMGEEKAAPLVYFQQFKHMCVGYAAGAGGTSEEGAEAEERQARARVLRVQKVEPKQAVLWMQMQRDAQVAACVHSTSRRVEVWGPTRQVLALALYGGEKVRRSRETAGDWDCDKEMHQVRKVMAMVDYGGARGRTKGHTIQVVSPQASATGAMDQGVTDLVQEGL